MAGGATYRQSSRQRLKSCRCIKGRASRENVQGANGVVGLGHTSARQDDTRQTACFVNIGHA